MAKEAEARDIIARLKKDPGAFAKLAAEKSKDPGSAAKGGELGWFDLKGMVPEFGAAVSKMEKGKFSEEPVKSQFGYHVILLEDTRPIEAPPLDAGQAAAEPAAAAAEREEAPRCAEGRGQDRGGRCGCCLRAGGFRGEVGVVAGRIALQGGARASSAAAGSMPGAAELRPSSGLPT